FFSSRRRHTRFSRDWSSDVCSSDLLLPPPRLRRPEGRREGVPVLQQAVDALQELLGSLGVLEALHVPDVGEDLDPGQLTDLLQALVGHIGTVIVDPPVPDRLAVDRKSTRLNSSHVKISYAVFCLKKKTTGRVWRFVRRTTA